MSKKSLTTMKDENQELQKQIGCISGFFQLFDRHRFLTGATSNNSIKELNNNTTKKAKVKNAKASIARENQQFSTESSGTSMSSSCSSSMSSLEFNRTIQLEPPSINQMKIPENINSEQAMKQLDFHDIVKDSLHIDAQRLSVKTVAKEEKKGGKILKRIDSPRPLLVGKPVNAGVTVVAWDSPRLSYDDRNIQNTLKSATKQRELPRLSLDSREKSIKSFNEGMKSQNLLKVEETETCRKSSSVVAKLMGLEAFPDWTQTCDSCNNNKDESFEESSTSDEYIKQQSSKRSKSSTKAPNGSLSVYGEIEKRMADLEFKKSGKDLRALKQILGAMHRYKESLDNTRDQASNSPSDNRSNSSISESLSVQSPRILQKDPKSATVENLNSTQGSKSPIVIMKPANVARKTNNSGSTKGMLVDKLDRKTTKGSPAIKHVKDSTNQTFHSVDKSNKMRTSKLMQSSKVSQVIKGENNTDSSNIVETRSPRLQKKFDFERRSQPTTSTSPDPSSNKRQQNRKSIKLSSPSTTSRQKFSASEERNESFKQMRYQKRDIKQEVDAVSLDFDCQRSIDSHSDIEVIDKGLNKNNVEKDLSKESFMAETIVTAEQPSPVSVLDAAFYREDPPSPVKRKSDISKDLDEVLSTYDISEESSNDLPLSPNTKVNLSNGTSDIDLKTHNLVQMLEQIDYSDERFTSFNDHKDPDHKYISEILIASELLTSSDCSQALHSSGYPINPMLFLALEKIKTNNMHFDIQQSPKKNANVSNHEQMQRKLIFDVVNEILVQKLEDRKQKGQQLLDVLCTEIDNLQHRNRNVSLANEDENVTSILREDLIHHPTVSTECYNEIPNVVLDIERLIFKDLITDVVRDEVVNHSGKYCRKLQLVTK